LQQSIEKESGSDNAAGKIIIKKREKNSRFFIFLRLNSALLHSRR
jgi:hypothetical protein